MQRPKWEEYLMGLAYVVSQRSLDINTKHGTIIVDDKNRILGTGYNSFARGLKDGDLPNSRPEKYDPEIESKYDWMIHSEINALANCVIKPENGIAYITGKPCNNCLMSMWQNGIKKIICGSQYSWKQNSDKCEKIFNKFIDMTKIEVIYIKPDLQWLYNLRERIE